VINAGVNTHIKAKTGRLSPFKEEGRFFNKAKHAFHKAKTAFRKLICLKLACLVIFAKIQR
jgi:hypothetical protein